MRYFLLIFAICCVTVVLVAGKRGDFSRKPPIELFPDMNRHPRLRPQTPDAFFADGKSSRLPVEGTIARDDRYEDMPVNTGRVPGTTNFIANIPVGRIGQPEDIASVIRWVRAHADEVGIDASRIFLMGHSAGAAHAGSYAYDKRLQPPAGPGIAGFIVVSGRVRAETFPENPNAHKVAAYYETEDAARLDDISPVSHVSADSVPTFVAWGEYENPLIDLHCAELVYRLAAAKRRSPPMFWLRGHNHTSTIGHINTAEDDLGRALLDFVANPR